VLIAVLAVIFALQNTAAVTVSFFIWHYTGSLALVLLFSVVVGVLISLLASLPGLIKGSWTGASQRKKLASLESALSEARSKADLSEKEVKTLEEQLASLSAALEEAQKAQPPAPSGPNQPPAQGA
jgi:septal ring factor EnvC (AmiA/AmiB activator)